MTSLELNLSSDSVELQVESGCTVTFGGEPRLVNSDGFDLSPEVKSVLQAIESGSYSEVEVGRGELVAESGTGGRFTTSCVDDMANWSKDADGNLKNEVNLDSHFVSWSARG